MCKLKNKTAHEIKCENQELKYQKLQKYQWLDFIKVLGQNWNQKKKNQWDRNWLKLVKMFKKLRNK